MKPPTTTTAPATATTPGPRGRRICIRETFETDCEVFFVFNGTAANSLSLASMCQSYHSIICHETRARRNRRVRRAGVLLQRHEGPAGARRRRQAHARRHRAHRQQARRRPLSKAARREPDAGHRAGHGLHARRAEGDLGGEPAPRSAAPHGRRALRQRRRLAGRRAEGDHLAGRRRRALLRRHEERHATSARRWSSSTTTWRASSTTAASRPASSPRRCGSSRRRGSGCSRTAPGCGARPTPTRWPQLLHESLSVSPACASSFRARPTRCSSNCPTRVIEALRARGWRFYTFIGEGGCRLMCAWDTTPEDVRDFVADLRELL